MRVVFMGTPDFAVGTLEAIINSGHEVVCVITQPDKPKGRGKGISMSAVKQKALEYELPIYQPERIRNTEAIEEVKKMNADVIVVVAFGQILPKEILEMPKYGCINVHASILPAYRGASPIQHAVLDGCEKTGVTTMLMDEGLDTGDILMQEEVVIDKKETGGSLFEKLCPIGADLLIKTLAKLEDGTIKRVKQDDSKSNITKQLKKTFGEIDFSKDAAVIERLVRGLNPWPSAYTYLDGKTLKIWDVDVISDSSDKEAGTVIDIDKNSFTVKCKTDAVKINELQLEGKKRMHTDAFLRGNILETGFVIGRR